MSNRPVVVTLSSFSPSTPSLVAPLRVAIGLASAYRQQNVTIMLCDEGVLHALKDRNPAWVDRYIISARAHTVELWVDQASLEHLGIQHEQLHSSIQIKETDKFWETRSLRSLNLSF